MNSVECTVDVDAPPDQVFDTIHDYSRRLEWDPFLARAELLGDANAAGRGVEVSCATRRKLGGLRMDTVYLGFERPKVAAVKMTDGPFFIGEFAASIRQHERADGRTTVSYKFRLTARPRWLRSVLEPLLAWVFARETRKRLRCLKRFVESEAAGVARGADSRVR